MTDEATKGAPPKDQQKAGEKAADTSIAEVQDQVAEAQNQGFFGTKVDPLPNSAHSLESGPDSPTAVEQLAALAKEA